MLPDDVLVRVLAQLEQRDRCWPWACFTFCSSYQWKQTWMLYDAEPSDLCPCFCASAAANSALASLPPRRFCAARVSQRWYDLVHSSEVCGCVAFEWSRHWYQRLDWFHDWLLEHGEHVRRLRMHVPWGSRYRQSQDHEQVISCIARCADGGQLEELDASWGAIDILFDPWGCELYGLKQLRLCSHRLRLPSSLPGLTSLRKLQVKGKLCCEPGMRLPSTLEALEVTDAPDCDTLLSQARPQHACWLLVGMRGWGAAVWVAHSSSGRCEYLPLFALLLTAVRAPPNALQLASLNQLHSLKLERCLPEEEVQRVPSLADANASGLVHSLTDHVHCLPTCIAVH